MEEEIRKLELEVAKLPPISGEHQKLIDTLAGFMVDQHFSSVENKNYDN